MNKKDEIIICENMIKKIEEELLRVNREINNNKDRLLKNKISIGILIPFLLMMCISSIVTENYFVLFIPGIFSVGLPSVIVECFEIKKVLNGLNNVKIYLQNEQAGEKIKLISLKINDKKSISNEKYLCDKERLSNVNNSINFEYNLGYNEKEYLKYYNNGTLKEKLKKDNEYSFQEINEIENHFKTKKLIKRKR